MSDHNHLTTIGVVEENPLATASIFDAANARTTIAQAAEVCTAIRDVAKQQNMLVSIGGKWHPSAIAYETAAAACGMTTSEHSVLRDNDGTFIAVVDVIRLNDGTKISRGSSICAPDEKLWKDRPEHARRSMSVTRAKTRALRNVLGWVFRLAGYSEIGADEVDDLPMPKEPAATPTPPPAEADDDGATNDDEPDSVGVELDTSSENAGAETAINDAQIESILSLVAEVNLPEADARAMVARHGANQLKDLSGWRAEKMIHELRVLRTEGQSPF